MLDLQNEQLTRTNALVEQQRLALEAVLQKASVGGDPQRPQQEDVEMPEENDEMKKSVAAYLEKLKLPGTIAAKVRSSAAVLKKKLLSLGRSEIHLEKICKNMEELKENRIPSNMKKFSLPWTSEYFMAPVEGMANQIMIKVDESATFEEARRKLYLEFLKSDTLLNYEVEKKRVANLRDQCSLESFIKICENHVDEDYKSVAQVIDNVEVPRELFEPMSKEVKEEAMKQYRFHRASLREGKGGAPARHLQAEGEAGEGYRRGSQTVGT